MNLVEKLAREIGRVSEQVGQWEAISTGEGVAGSIASDPLRPGIMLKRRSIEHACVAIGSGDILAISVSIDDLQGFTE